MDEVPSWGWRWLTVYPSPYPVISLLHRLGDREPGKEIIRAGELGLRTYEQGVFRSGLLIKCSWT